MSENSLNGDLVVKSIKSELASISSGKTQELKVRFSGDLMLGDKHINVESLTLKGSPDDMKEIMEFLNIDSVDEMAKWTLHKNMQSRLDDSLEDEE